MKVIAKKRFGQNFLRDENILHKIATAIDINDEKIIEIGPGEGALTKYLINNTKQVVAFEIDYDLVKLLNEKFNSTKNLEIINQDFLKVDLSQYHGYKIVANIPYYISTDILFKIFENSHLFDEIILLVQKEFAQRVCAHLSQKDYGKLSITTNIFYTPKILFDVSPTAFSPQPKVVSSVIYLKRKNWSLAPEEKRKFSEFIKKSFAMKRKTLINNLKKEYELAKIETFLKEQNLNLQIRPEQISFELFFRLFMFLTC